MGAQKIQCLRSADVVSRSSGQRATTCIDRGSHVVFARSLQSPHRRLRTHRRRSSARATDARRNIAPDAADSAATWRIAETIARQRFLAPLGTLTNSDLESL